MDWKLGFYIQLSILCSTFTLLLLYVFCSRYVKHNKTIEKISKKQKHNDQHCHQKLPSFFFSFFFCRCRQFNDEGNQNVKENETFESGRMSFKFDNSAYEE